MAKNPDRFVGWEMPAADGGYYGIQLVAYMPGDDQYVTRAILWDTGEYLDEHVRTITPFKLSYRYMPNIRRRMGSI
jgi:hypothetical protein